nr:disease resistance protein RPM1-like [Ziziphus jujuba var. spinosa]
MAETAVCFLINKLLQLSLTKEVKLIRGIQKELADIREELESICSFLKDADAKAALIREDMDDGIKTWLKQVRKSAYHIEDVIDIYMLRVCQPRLQHHGYIGFLQKVAFLVTKIKPRHEIASKIRSIKLSIIEIKARSERYGFNSYERGPSNYGKDFTWHNPRAAALFIEEDEVVGIESARDELIGWLVEKATKRSVVSVVGMGGLGKTTLAKKVFDSQKVKAHFDCYAWISVSQSYKIEDLLRMMIKQFCKERKEYTPERIDTMDGNLLLSKSREYLQQKRYVVVFDDVWQVNFWGLVEHALPNNSKGGRVIITTRNQDVAYFCKKSSFVHVHHLKPLSEEKAWELFCSKAFQFDDGGTCPPELEKLSLEIVKRCRGLPLALVSIAGLLSTKDKVISEWRKLHNSLRSELEKNPHLTSITRILSLSYHDLPYYLKSCFLYFGIFPEDYSVSCVRLVRLWIAEGFVKPREGTTMEEVAEEYLTELIHRSLIQVPQVNIDGKARSCQIHDLWREIILQKMVDLSFCHVFSAFEAPPKQITRRLSIDKTFYEASESIEFPHVRSIFIFNQEEMPKSFVSTFTKKFKLLKVLDFTDAPLDHLPNYVGNLFHLRYLSLRNTKVKWLPKSIVRLQYLETLDLKQSLVFEIPVEVNKLLKLRNLLARFCNYEIRFCMSSERGVKIKEGIECLTSLQKLYHVEVNHGGVQLIEELGKLKQLKKLGLKNLTTENCSTLCASIEKMKKLESLEICSTSEDETLDLQHISTPPEFLRRLYLKGHLEKLPDWIIKLQHLVKDFLGRFKTGATGSSEKSTKSIGAWDFIQGVPC